MGLGVEEDLRVHDVVAMHPHQIGPRQVVEVLLGQQHPGALVVEIQELLEVAKLVRGSQLLDRGIREMDPVAFRDLEHQLRLQRAFDVHVELGLRESLEEGRDGIQRLAPL
jgi:hypothetical protein